jgi:glucosyl-dolichyl phosphate glucuronosyltransferase
MLTDETEVSVVIPTYNRSELLRNAVSSVLRQNDSQITFEIIVVDNNSRDNTREVVFSLIEEHPQRLRYIVETQQGNAYARNAGINIAKGAIIAFIDDDVTVEGNWLRSLKAAFDRRGDLSFVGGKVLPEWSGTPPSWLTPDHWSPLALLDYGSDKIAISGKKPRGLLTANIAFRKNVFGEVGLFSPHLQRVKNSIGSMEDHEFLLRVCRRGKQGMYLPEMIARSPVDIERLTKDYHRRWHTGHGYFYALMRDPEWERSMFRVIDVPGHLYKQAAAHAVNWFSGVLRNADSAFIHECHLRFFLGFFVARQKERFKRERSNQRSALSGIMRDEIETRSEK